MSTVVFIYDFPMNEPAHRVSARCRWPRLLSFPVVRKLLDALAPIVPSAHLPAVDSHAPQPVILPQSVRTALQFHPDRFRVPEIRALLDPNYGVLGLYLACKYLSDMPQHLQQLLEAYILYVSSSQQGDDYHTFYEKALGLLEQHHKGKAINGVKARQLSMIGFSLDEQGKGILEHLRNSGETPVFVLYASILMMPSILDWMQVGDKVFFIDPYDSTDTSQGIAQEGVDEAPPKGVATLTLCKDILGGWFFTKHGDDSISVTMIDPDHPLTGFLGDTQTIRLIDDTHNPANPAFGHIVSKLEHLLGPDVTITSSFAVTGDL